MLIFSQTLYNYTFFYEIRHQNNSCHLRSMINFQLLIKCNMWSSLEPLNNVVEPLNNVVKEVNQILFLIAGRWVGIDSLMAVQSKENKGYWL